MQEGWHRNVQPNEPLQRTGGLPLGSMEKIWEEIAELLRERLNVSVSILEQSYRKPYNHRFDTVPYPQGPVYRISLNFPEKAGKECTST
jgi:hypothetical protein